MCGCESIFKNECSKKFKDLFDVDFLTNSSFLQWLKIHIIFQDKQQTDTWTCFTANCN